MRQIFWLFLAACASEGVIGDACDEHADCEDGLVCLFDDPTDDEAGGACIEMAAFDTDEDGPR